MSLSPICRVHPMVLFSITDSFERRADSSFRSIGTLLGVYEKGAVEITNAFTVMHNENESGEVSIDLDYARNMLEIHRATNSQEKVLGWYSTGNVVSEASLLIHEYYSKECKSPVHLTVDVAFKNSRPEIKAYISSTLGVMKNTIGTMFVPIKVEVVYYQTEKVAIEAMRSGLENKKRQVYLTNEIENVASSSEKIQEQLTVLIEYCEEVLSGKTTADSNIGRSILELVDNVPKLDKDEFEEMFNSNMKDMLMVIYLTKLVKTQLKIGERINLLKGAKIA